MRFAVSRITRVTHTNRVNREPRPHSTCRSHRAGRIPLLRVVAAAAACAVPVCAGSAAWAAGDSVYLTQYGGANAQQYNAATGSLVRTYSDATTTHWEGTAVTASGTVISTFQGPSSGFDVFDASGSRIRTVSTSAVQLAGDVSLFSDGNLAICDQSSDGLTGAIDIYSQTGTLLNSFGAGALADPFANFINPADDTLWVVSGGTAVGQLGKVSHYTEAGSLLGSFTTSFLAGDMVVSPTDGSIWIVDQSGSPNNHRLRHLSFSGASLGSFSVGVFGSFTGVGISSDGATLYTVGSGTSSFLEYSTSGAQVGSIAISNLNQPTTLTVVPAASAPEPSAAALCLCGLLAAPVAVCRRSRAA